MKGERLLDAIGKIDDSLVYSAVNDAPRKKKGGLFRWGAIAACFVVIVFAAAFILQNCLNQQGTASSNETDGVITDNSNDDTQPAESGIHISMEKIFFNEIGGLSDAARKWYDPELYDEIVWNKSDVIDYYGRDITPVYIPNGLAAAPGNGSAMVIAEKSGKLVLDTVWYGFYHDYYEDGSPKLTENVAAKKGFFITVSKIGLLNDCIYLLPENEVKTSDIEGITVIFGYRSMPYGPYDPETHESAGYYDMYTAEFMHNGTEYQIIAEQMEAKEVVKVVTSIITGTGEKDIGIDEGT